MSAERVHGVTKDQRPSGEAVLVSMISSALNGVKQGKTREYDTLIQMLADPELKDVQLRRCLHALKSCYSCLTKEYDMLVGTVLNTRWATCDQDTVEEFIEFLSCLLSAQTFYLRACLHMIVKLFLPAGRSKDMDPNSVDHEALEQIFANGHEALQAVSEIVPTVPQFLTPVLSANFPYMGKPTIFLESYVKNLLEITKYLPGLRPKILELITYHLIKLDVEIPKHELEHDQKELDDEDEEHGQLEVDMDTAKHETEGTENDKEEQQMEHEMANKLDTLMLLLFEYITDITHTNGEYNIDGGTELFNTLLVVFEDVILPTHASCHVQFIMFHLSSLDLVFANSLLDLWWGKIKDPNMPGIIRQASAAYVASFASRAKFIPISVVQTCLNLISHWIHCCIDLHDADCPGPDANKHGPFYSVCQALFYIFIFRHKQLMELEGGLKYIRRLNLERIVSCRLNPLKVCLPTVVRLFAQVTRQHELVFCYTIIERNNRMMLPVATSTSSRAVSSLTLTNQLDSFFPFDPYLLRRSAKYITPFYQEWEGLEHNEEEYEDVQHSEAEDESEDNLDYLENPDATVPGFTPDTPMCVAPGFVSSPATC